MAILIPALVSSRYIPAELSEQLLDARYGMKAIWTDILESVVLYSNFREWTGEAKGFSQRPIYLVGEILKDFGLGFGMHEYSSDTVKSRVMEAYAEKDLFSRWNTLPGNLTRDTSDWHGDPDESLYVGIKEKGVIKLELELRYVIDHAGEGWTWEISNEKGDTLYAYQRRDEKGFYQDVDSALEDLRATYESIRKVSSQKAWEEAKTEAKGTRKRDRLLDPLLEIAEEETKKRESKKRRSRGAFVPAPSRRKRHVKPPTEQDVLRQAVEFGDIPAFPEYEQTISKLLRKKHLQASATEPGAYHITAAGIRALPERNPAKDKYEVKAVGTLFSLETGNQPARQTLTIEAGSHDEARKKAASRMVERAELMGYEFSGRHKDFKSKKMNPRRKKPKRNAHIPVQRGRAKIPTSGKGFGFVGSGDVFTGEGNDVFEEKTYLYTYRKDPQYFVVMIPLDLSIKMEEFGELRRWSGQALPQWIVEVAIGDAGTGLPYMRIGTIEAGTTKEAFQRAAEIIGKDKRAPKKRIEVTQRRWELAEGYATGSNPKKKAKASGPDHRTGKPRKRKVHQAFSKWTDAQKMAKKHPDTFDAPDLGELKSDVKIGDYVKWNIGAERMWLLVVDVEGDTITGLLSNYPLDERYQMDDVVRIKFKHVYDYKRGDKESLERAEAFLDELVEKAKSIRPKRKTKKKAAKKAARKKNPARPVKRTINRGLIHRWIGDNDVGKHTLYDPKQMGKHHITPSSTAVAVMNVEDGDFLPRAMADIYEEDWAIELLAQFTMFLKSAGYQWQPVKDDETGMWYEVVKRERGNPVIGERKGRPGWRKPQPGWALLMIAAGKRNQLHEWSREAPVLERAGMIERKRDRYEATRKGLEILYKDYPDFIVDYEEMRSAHPEEDWKPLPRRPNPKTKKATKKKVAKKATKKNPRDPNDPILKWFPIGKKLQGALSIIRKPDKTEWRMWRIADAYSTSDGWSVYLDTLTIRTLMLAGHAPSRHSMEGGGAIDNIRIIIRKKGNKAIVTVPDNPAHYYVYKSLTISVKPGEDPYGVVASAIVWFGEKADRIPPVDDYDREALISAVASNWRKARGSGRVANFPHARVIVRNLLGEWRSFPRSENPAKAKKKVAKKAPKKKVAKKKETLIGKAHRLWDEYYEKPTKKALKSVLDHLEDMERSTGKRVRAEWRKAKRSARAEAKRLGVKV